MSRKPHRVGAPKKAEKQPERGRSPFRPEWIAAALVLIATAWMVTEGDWNFTGITGRLEGFYEAQAESLLHGRIDVPAEAIGDEAFVRNGKNYGYFGPTPALFRIPLVLLAPGMNGKWSRWSMLVGTAVMLGALLLLIVRLEELMPGLARAPSWAWLRTALVLAAGIGSTQFFVAAESKVYQESIEWASSLSLVSLVCVLSYLMERRMRWLWIACAAAFLAFFARVSSGAGPIFALFAVDLALLLPYTRVKEWLGVEGVPDRQRAIAALTGTVALTAALWMGLNYWKFGMVFTSQPMYMQRQYDADRMARIKGDLASPLNIPLTTVTYFSPGNIRFMRGFPWVQTIVVPRDELRARFPSAHYDYCEWFAAVEDGMPALFFGALAGTFLCLSARGGKLRQLRAPLLGAIAGSALVFMWGLIAYRYLHDLFPWHVIGAAAALGWIATREDTNQRRGLTALFVAATAWSMWMNFAFGIEHQRVRTFPVNAAKRMAFLDFSADTAKDGPFSVISHLKEWREYIPAWTGNTQGLRARQAASRNDWFVVEPGGPPPYAATYQVQVPADGEYELSVRYASAKGLPTLLTINGQPIGYVCAAPTGGDAEEFQSWVFGGRHKLPGGPSVLSLSANRFPAITFLRLTRVK